MLAPPTPYANNDSTEDDERDAKSHSDCQTMMRMRSDQQRCEKDRGRDRDERQEDDREDIVWESPVHSGVTI